MAKVYADLIRKGIKTIDDVPDKIKDKVKEVLIDLNWLSKQQDRETIR